MAVCLLLSYKFNECVTSKFHSRLDMMLDFIDKEWKISKKEVFDSEFGAFVQLGFSLLVPYQHVFLVFTRLLKLVYKTTRNYLGDDLMDLYNQDIMTNEYEIGREYERKLETAKAKKKKIEKDEEGGIDQAVGSAAVA